MPNIEDKAQAIVRNNVICSIGAHLDAVIKMSPEQALEADLLDIFHPLPDWEECAKANGFVRDEVREVIYDEEEHASAVGGGEAYDGPEYDTWEECCLEEGLDCEGYDNETLEFWMVSEELANRLEAKGEKIVRDWLALPYPVWCRCTSGQALYADYVIQQVAHDALTAERWL